MIVFKKVADIQDYLTQQRTLKQLTGFIPTMGALHAGHTSLIAKARENGLLTITSIFVNPTQFNDKNDFEKYPISIETDIEMLIEAGCDVLFLPSVAEIYPDGTENARAYSFDYLETVLEGAQRPGHFKGVGQVMNRLLDIVAPNYLYMGQKDYQQCLVIKKLISLMGKDDKIQMIVSPTLREADGLAMSSRNRRLTEPQRALAGAIYQCLVSIQAKQDNGDFKIVQRECMELLKDKGFEPEYIALADANDLTLLDNYSPNHKTVALIAAKIGGIRLIDNLILN